MSKGERDDRCLWQRKGVEQVAAVDKIEDSRKPEDFIGHRNRGTRRKWENHNDPPSYKKDPSFDGSFC